MGPAVQGGMAEGAVITGAGGMQSRAGVAGGGMDPDYPGRGPSPRDLVNAALAAKLASLANTLTQTYKDNQDNNNKNCKTFTYNKKGTECKGGKAHHMVPDRAWRSPGTRGEWTSIPPIDAKLSDLRESIPGIGKLYKGGYYYSNMDEGKGLCICLTGDDHDKVHAIYDEIEKVAGLSNKPQYTAKLQQLEELAAKTISAVTGCNEEKLKEDLKNHHESLGFSEDTLVRADPRGASGLTIEKFSDLVFNKTPGKVGF